jgi:gliding motility-associated-like protein
MVKKIIFTFLFFILFFHIGFSQSDGDYRTKQSGLWSASSTWETFNGTSWISATVSPTSSNGVISVLNSHLVTINASVTIDQTVIMFGGKVILSSGTLTVNNGIGDDLRILGEYERTSSTTTITINSGAIVLCENNGKYIHNVDGGSLPTITWQDGSLLDIKNSVSSNLNQSFWDVLIEGGNASTLSNNNTSRTMSVRNNLTQTGGTFYLKNGGTPGGVHTLEILGNYLHTGGLLGWNSMDFQNSSRTNLIIGGNYSLLSSASWTGYVSLTDCQSGIFFNGTSEQTFTSVFSHASGAVRDRFYIKQNHPGVHEVYVGTIQQSSISGTCSVTPPTGFLPWPTTGNILKSFTINNSSGSSFQLRHSRNIDQNLYRTNGSIELIDNSVISYNTGASLHYNGSTPITTENPEFPVLNGPTNFVINNVAGVTLHADRKVLGSLEFVQGILSTGSCNSSTNNTMLVLGSSSNVINAGLGKYVNGILRKIGNTEFTFTIGGNGRYAPVTISAPSNITDHFTACYVNADANGQGFNRNLREASLGTISPCEYWNVNRTNGSSNVTLTLGWDIIRGCNFINSLNDIKVARWNGSQWQDVGNSIQTGTVSSGLVTSQLVNDFSPFAISTQSVDLYASAVWIDDCTTVGDGKFFNTSGTGIDLISQEPGNTFQQNFGVHLQNSNTLILRGAEIKTFKNNSSNLCSPSIMRYRFFSDGATPGAFSTMTIPFYSDCNTSQNEFLLGGGPCSAGQQKWQRVVADGTTSPYSPINLTNLPPGNYTLQIFYELTGSNSFSNVCDETFVYNNNGNFYTASFTIVEMPILTTIQPTQCGGSGSIKISGLPANKVFEVSYLYNGVTVGPISATTNSSGEIVLNNLALGNYSGINLFSNSCNITMPNTVTIANPTLPNLSISSTNNTSCGNSPCEYNGPVAYINEIMFMPGNNFSTSVGDNTNPAIQSMFNASGTGQEWIEIYNPNPCAPLNLSCYVIGSHVGSSNWGAFAFPAGTSVPPLGFLKIGAGANVDINLASFLGTPNLVGSGRWHLENGCGYILLANPSGVVVNAVYWSQNNANDLTANTTCGGSFDNILNIPTVCNPTINPLPAAKDIANIEYAGNFGATAQGSNNIGKSISRTTDGGSTFAMSLVGGTPQACNAGPGNCTPPFVGNACNGTATVNVATGSGSYSYQWSASANNQTTQTATALCAGTHTVVVTDLVSNCQSTIPVTIITILPTAPTGLACYQTATFNNTTCIWDVTGTQPTAPTGLACYQTATFNNTTCIWDVTGTQPTAPTGLACYQTATFNNTTCIWDVTGTQPTAPTGLACYQTATFNNTTCIWDVTGTQPTAPTGLACYQTATFNNTTCIWDVTGTQPTAPTGLACYQTATFNNTTCIWDVTGTQPTAPTGLACYQTATFNNTTCIWDVTGSPAVITTSSGCNGASFEVTASVVSGVATYQWYDSSSNLIGTTATIVITESGTYEVRVTVNSCTTIEFVTVDRLPCVIPKGVSPNNDGLNDTWNLSGLNAEKVQIFNRYGVEVYSKSNYTNEWEGKTNSGNELPDGTYYYVVSLPGGALKTGWVYINRQQ